MPGQDIPQLKIRLPPKAMTISKDKKRKRPGGLQARRRAYLLYIGVLPVDCQSTNQHLDDLIRRPLSFLFFMFVG